MQVLGTINSIIAILFTVCYFYQILYIPIVLLFKKKLRYPDTDQKNKYAVLICARNERLVLPDLIRSIKAQTYDPSLLSIFVMADNCTDDTAEVAEACGATKVYRRQNKELVGKGYALQTLLQHLQQDYPEGFDGYFVFDADNVLAPNYVEEMNKAFASGFDILTSFRNSKNYGDNWISAGYALWFIRESRYLNHARALIHSSCAVSGTGFLFSRKIAEEIKDWPFHLLVEDIQFSVYNIVKGRKIGFCPNAELFDEQPVKFRQSWRQRLRWSRGYIQVFRNYGGKMFGGIFKGWFSCYDMAMTIMPAFVLSTLTLVINLFMIVRAIVIQAPLRELLSVVWPMFYGIYILVFIIGAITIITEWKRIRTTAFKKIFYAFTFPLFMATYIPISIHSLFTKVTWKPIEHTRTVAAITAKEKEASLK